MEQRKLQGPLPVCDLNIQFKPLFKKKDINNNL